MTGGVRSGMPVGGGASVTGREFGSGILPVASGDCLAARRVRSGRPGGGGARIVGAAIDDSLSVVSACGSMPGLAGVLLSGVKDTSGKVGLGGALISFD